MRKTSVALLFFFIFLSLFSINAFAYLPVDLNVSYSTSFTNIRAVRCSNLTGTIYCYVFGEQGIERFNATLGGKVSCSYGYGNRANSVAIINSTAVWVGASNAIMYNLTKMTGTCQQLKSSTNLGLGVSDSIHSYGAGYNNEVIYWSYASGNGSIKYKDNSTNALSGFWGAFETLAMPNVNDNITIFLGNVSGDESFHEYYDGYEINYFPSIEDTYGISGSPFWDMILENNTTWIYFHIAGSNRIYRANISALLESNYTGCTYAFSGTRCDGATAYIITSGCTEISGSCPLGTICSQLTPQINVSSDLVENYTSCQIITNGGLKINCFNMCFIGTIIFSNCIETQCKQCPDVNGKITYQGVPGFYTNTWFTNQSSVSVPSYTIACINTTTGSATVIIDENGNTTNETELLTRAGNNVTTVLPSGVPPSSNSITSLGSWINIGLGTSYGSELIAFITSLFFATALFFKINDKKIEAFIVPFLAILCGFCLPGVEFFPLWIWLLMTVFTGVLIFWKAKSG